MDTKLLSSCLRKYHFHHMKALEEDSCALEQLETVIVTLMNERKIPDDKVVSYEILPHKFIYVYTSGGHLYFRYPNDSFPDGYYDSCCLEPGMRPDMISLLEILTGEEIGNLLK